MIVAIAGATGQVGKSLVKGLSSKSGLELVILSRKKHDNLDTTIRLIPSITYDSIPALTLTLTANNIHTVVSALSDDAGEAELNLIAAANASPPTKRFIASDWGVAFPAEAVEVLPFVKYRFLTIDTLHKTNLEWTRVHNGYFMDYYGSQVVGLPFVIDVAGKAAAIPGSGDDFFVLTHTNDLAEFVARLLMLDHGEWEEVTYLYSERVTWNRVLRLAEEITGNSFTVSHESLDKLQKLEITKLPGHGFISRQRFEVFIQPMFALFGQYIIQGFFDVDEAKSLNARFPDIVPTKTGNFLRQSWQGS